MALTGFGDILRKARGRFPQFDRRIREAEALSRWEEAVGPQIAKHSRALRVQDGILWVEVAHPLWRTELHHRKRQIIEALNQKKSPVAARTPPPGADRGPARGSSPGTGRSSKAEAFPPSTDETITDVFFVEAHGAGSK